MDVRKITDPLEAWSPIMKYMCDDTGPSLPDGDFLGVFDGERMAGAFLIKSINGYCCEIHGGVHPCYWGEGSKICRDVGKSIFTESECLKIICMIPAYNRLMIKCIKSLGMKQEGKIKNAFMKKMKMHDLLIFGITKGEARCQPQW
jgi:RimJ/RimL family protein N-acetyltransferase